MNTVLFTLCMIIEPLDSVSSLTMLSPPFLTLACLPFCAMSLLGNSLSFLWGLCGSLGLSVLVKHKYSAHPCPPHAGQSFVLNNGSTCDILERKSMKHFIKSTHLCTLLFIHTLFHRSIYVKWHTCEVSGNTGVMEEGSVGLNTLQLCLQCSLMLYCLDSKCFNKVLQSSPPPSSVAPLLW